MCPISCNSGGDRHVHNARTSLTFARLAFYFERLLLTFARVAVPFARLRLTFERLYAKTARAATRFERLHHMFERLSLTFETSRTTSPTPSADHVRTGFSESKTRTRCLSLKRSANAPPAPLEFESRLLRHPFLHTSISQSLLCGLGPGFYRFYGYFFLLGDFL